LWRLDRNLIFGWCCLLFPGRSGYAALAIEQGGILPLAGTGLASRAGAP